MAVTLSTAEQETVILLSRDGNTATLYTSDTRDRRRLNKMYGHMRTRVYRDKQGNIVAEEFTIDRRLLAFRSKIPRRPELTAEQKAEVAARLRTASTKARKKAAADEKKVAM